MTISPGAEIPSNETEGRPVLCRSAPLTYFEFVEPDGKRVTDVEWKARLDSKTPPAPPPWLAPVFGD